MAGCYSLYVCSRTKRQVMKQILFALGICIAAGVCAQQNQPDSLHVVLRENQNGTMRTLDTIVPLSQQQQLFAWMKANGWEAPPPPPPHPAAPHDGPMQFERRVVIEGDAAANKQDMVFVTSDGDTIHRSHCKMMVIHMDGDSADLAALPPLPPVPPVPPLPPLPPLGELSPLAPLPPLPPMEGMKVIVMNDSGVVTENIMMMPPMPPGAGGNVLVEVTEKDTVIDGEMRKMIIRTERIILPPPPPAPPTTPQAPKQQAGTPSKQKLLVYPNPSGGLISVEFDVNAKEKTVLRVLDMNGKVVYTEEIVDENGKHVYREINLSDKGKGTYTVEVRSGKKAIVEKVILQ